MAKWKGYGPLFNIKTVFPWSGIPTVKIISLCDRFIFILVIPIPERRHLYTETIPWSYFQLIKVTHIHTAPQPYKQFRDLPSSSGGWSWKRSLLMIFVADHQRTRTGEWLGRLTCTTWTEVLKHRCLRSMTDVFTSEMYCFDSFLFWFKLHRNLYQGSHWNKWAALKIITQWPNLQRVITWTNDDRV